MGFSENRKCLNPELDHRSGSVIFTNFELNFWSGSGRFRFEPRFGTELWQHYSDGRFRGTFLQLIQPQSLNNVQVRRWKRKLEGLQCQPRYQAL